VKILNEDELVAAIPLANALRNSQPSVPAYRHLRAPAGANSHHFRASGASWPRRRPPNADATAQSVASP
jgi:hypothetical protein